MSLTDLEQTVFAHYVATAAKDLNPAPRWYPYGELILIVEDKVAVASRKFGLKAKGCAKVVGTAFLDLMIEKGGWTTKQNDYGGSMHQFQQDTYRKVLAELAANDPIILAAQAGGEDFWAARFAELAG